MERINIVGKPQPNGESFLNLIEQTCDNGHKKTVKDCPFCAAPLCCHECGCPSLETLKNKLK